MENGVKDLVLHVTLVSFWDSLLKEHIDKR